MFETCCGNDGASCMNGVDSKKVFLDGNRIVTASVLTRLTYESTTEAYQQRRQLCIPNTGLREHDLHWLSKGVWYKSRLCELKGFFWLNAVMLCDPLIPFRSSASCLRHVLYRTAQVGDFMQNISVNCGEEENTSSKCYVEGCVWMNYTVEGCRDWEFPTLFPEAPTMRRVEKNIERPQQSTMFTWSLTAWCRR